MRDICYSDGLLNFIVEGFYDNWDSLTKKGMRDICYSDGLLNFIVEGFYDEV